MNRQFPLIKSAPETGRKPKILLVHNYYRSENPSGENRVFDQERDLLARNGHEIDRYIQFSDEIARKGRAYSLPLALAIPWNFSSAQEFSKKIKDFRPDIIHVHNTFPLMSPSIFYQIPAHVRVVMTLHNYRLICAAATLERSGVPCTECLDNQSSIPALRHACYRASRIKTAPLAAMISLHQILGTWRSKVDAFITLTEFQRSIFQTAGYPPERLFVKPNFHPDPGEPIPTSRRENCVLFVGRLSAEKGVLDLVRAWEILGNSAPTLKIIGDGPLRPSLKRYITRASLGGKVHLLGHLSHLEAQKHMSTASLLVVPSTWFEGLPLVIVEAFSRGVPVAAANIGSLSELVTNNKNGILFRPGDPFDMVSKLNDLWGSQKLEDIAKNARLTFTETFTEGRAYQQLANIYTSISK